MTAEFDLTPMGRAETGGHVFRLRNDTEQVREFILTGAGSDFAYMVELAPGDCFVEVARSGIYRLTLGAASKNSHTLKDEIHYAGTVNYREDPGPVGFVAGTMIRTDKGDKPVETLSAGDKVLTLDGGFHTVRDMQGNHVFGMGEYAPVLIPAGSIGNSRDILLSPAQRVRVSDWRAELLHGHANSFATAGDLLIMDGVERRPQQKVEYHHPVFDDRVVILSSGLWVENVPSLRSARPLEMRGGSELLTLFPDLFNPGNHAATMLTLQGASDPLSELLRSRG